MQKGPADWQGPEERARLSGVVDELLDRRVGVGRREEPPRDESGFRAHGSNQQFHRLLRHAVARAQNRTKPRRRQSGGGGHSHPSWVAAQGPPGTLSHRPFGSPGLACAGAVGCGDETCRGRRRGRLRPLRRRAGGGEACRGCGSSSAIAIRCVPCPCLGGGIGRRRCCAWCCRTAARRSVRVFGSARAPAAPITRNGHRRRGGRSHEVSNMVPEGTAFRLACRQASPRAPSHTQVQNPQSGSGVSSSARKAPPTGARITLMSCAGSSVSLKTMWPCPSSTNPSPVLTTWGLHSGSFRR